MPLFVRSVIMSICNLLKVQPTELKFPFELKKQSSCSLQLSNKGDQHVAFKVKTTNPKKYCVRPNAGVVLPGSTCDVTVTMQAQTEAPPDMQCKDKFLLQSVVVEDGTTTDDVNSEMFNKAPDRVVEEFKLRVIYIPGNPPSPVPEGSEEGSSPKASMLDSEADNSSVSGSQYKSAKEKNPEMTVLISKLTEEKDFAIQQNQKLHQELDQLRKESKKHSGDFSIMFVVMVAILSIILGFSMK